MTRSAAVTTLVQYKLPNLLPCSITPAGVHIPTAGIKTKLWETLTEAILCTECRGNGHLPFTGPDAKAGDITVVCNIGLWPVRRQVYRYLPSPLTIQYQIILLGDRGTEVNNLPRVAARKHSGRTCDRITYTETLNIHCPFPIIPFVCSVLSRCWLGDRKDIKPVKLRVSVLAVMI